MNRLELTAFRSAETFIRSAKQKIEMIYGKRPGLFYTDTNHLDVVTRFCKLDFENEERSPEDPTQQDAIESAEYLCRMLLNINNDIKEAEQLVKAIKENGQEK